MEINYCNRNDLAPSTVKINIECLQNKLQGEKRERETRGTIKQNVNEFVK